MFNVNGREISLSRGDTGAIRFKVNAKYLLPDPQTGLDVPYVFSERDRVVFTVKSGTTVVKERYFPISHNETTGENTFIVSFFNQDTDSYSPGGYSWDTRYVINPRYDDNGRIVDGDQVITPKQPAGLQLLTVVGDI